MEKITRRILPHWYVPGAMHFLTFRLAGSLPAQVLEELRLEKERLLRRVGVLRPPLLQVLKLFGKQFDRLPTLAGR